MLRHPAPASATLAGPDPAVWPHDIGPGTPALESGCVLDSHVGNLERFTQPRRALLAGTPRTFSCKGACPPTVYHAGALGHHQGTRFRSLRECRLFLSPLKRG